MKINLQLFEWRHSLSLGADHEKSRESADLPRDVKVAGTPISQYVLVYAKDGQNLSDLQIQTVSYAKTAERLADRIEQIVGKRLAVVSDAEQIPSDAKRILFGKTVYNEDACNEPFACAGGYSCKLFENGTVVLAGDNPCSALAAGEAFADALQSAPEEGLSALEITAEKKIRKVACVGDSITFGTNSRDSALYNYPAYLQKLLGYDYYVEKYGAPSHSLIETDTPSFLKHAYFAESVSAKPDVVIVMLGTNDCRTQKWEDSAYKDWSDPARSQSFLQSGEKLIAAYRAANPNVQIFLATSPTVPQDAWLGTDWTERLVQYGNPLIAQLAKEQNCELIDVFAFSEQHPELFEGGDGLHPQDEQYGILAEGIYELIKDAIVKPE